MKDLFHVEIGEEKALPVLAYRFDHRAWERLQKTLLGKNILFTDNDGWTDAEIIRGYQSQHHVESAFRGMKDPLHIPPATPAPLDGSKDRVCPTWSTVMVAPCGNFSKSRGGNVISR